MTASSIYNLVRALTKPYVGAHFTFNDQDIKVWKSNILENKQNNIESGKVLNYEEDIMIVKTGEDSIILYDIPKNLKITKGDYI